MDQYEMWLRAVTGQFVTALHQVPVELRRDALMRVQAAFCLRCGEPSSPTHACKEPA